MFKSVLEQEPVPKNLRKTLRLDSTMKNFLREKDTLGTKMVINKDKSLSRITGKIRVVTGPLTKIRQQVERAKDNENDTPRLIRKEIDTERDCYVSPKNSYSHRSGMNQRH